MSPSERWRMIFGMGLIVILAALALIIALGRVEQQTSYGLMPIIVALTAVSTTFANWAFRIPERRDRQEDKEP